MAVLFSFAAVAQPKIQHKQILKGSQFQELEFNAVVTDSSDVTAVELYYRSSNAAAFSWLRMARSGNNYSVRLPQSAATLAGIQYYILATNRSGQSSTAPLNAPALYYEIIIRDDNAQPFLISRYPDRNDTVYTGRPEIRIGYFDDETIDRRRIRLLIDSVDVTKNSRVLPSSIGYTPPQSLDTGKHSIIVIIPDGEGNVGKGASWSFIVRPSPPEQDPFTLQTSVAASYGYTESVPVTSVQRTYGTDIAFHATQKLGGITLSSNAAVHTDQSMLPANGKKSVKLQGFSLSAAEVPVTLFYGDFSESFSEYGMSNNQLTGGQASFSSGPFSTFLFTGTSKNSGGTNQDFSGGRVEYGFEEGSQLSAFVIRGTDDTSSNAGQSNSGLVPINGTVIGLSGSFPSVAGTSISVEGAKSFSNMKEIDKTTTDPGLAGTISANGTVSIFSLNGSLHYADRFFHNPGNPFLEHDQYTGALNAGANLLGEVNTSFGYTYTRTGLSSDTSFQPTANRTYSVSGSGNPFSIMSLSGSYSYAEQKGLYTSVTAKDNQTHQYSASAGVNLSSGSVSLTYGVNDVNDFSLQRQSSLQKTFGVFLSLNPLQRLNASVNYNSSGSRSQTSSVVNTFTSFSGTLSYGFDEENQNSAGFSLSSTDNAASDNSQHSASLSLGLTFSTNFGIAGSSAPQVHFSTTWTTSTAYVPVKSAKESLQVFVTMSWTMNSTI